MSDPRVDRLAAARWEADRHALVLEEALVAKQPELRYAQLLAAIAGAAELSAAYRGWAAKLVAANSA